jgi:hypothetical protein
MLNRTRLFELALKGLEAERHRIDQEIREIRNQLGIGYVRSLSIPAAPTRRATKATAPRKRGKMSAAQRKAISQAMRRTWAERRRGNR